MINETSKKILKEQAGYEGDCEFEINRKSKWIVEVSLVDGMSLIAKFKINARTGAFDKIR
jgi:hypothetical protein